MQKCPYVRVKAPEVREDTQRTLTVICELLEDTGMDKTGVNQKECVYDDFKVEWGSQKDEGVSLWAK